MHQPSENAVIQEFRQHHQNDQYNCHPLINRPNCWRCTMVVHFIFLFEWTQRCLETCLKAYFRISVLGEKPKRLAFELVCWIKQKALPMCIELSHQVFYHLNWRRWDTFPIRGCDLGYHSSLALSVYFPRPLLYSWWTLHSLTSCHTGL